MLMRMFSGRGDAVDVDHLNFLFDAKSKFSLKCEGKLLKNPVVTNFYNSIRKWAREISSNEYFQCSAPIHSLYSVQTNSVIITDPQHLLIDLWTGEYIIQWSNDCCQIIVAKSRQSIFRYNCHSVVIIRNHSNLLSPKYDRELWHQFRYLSSHSHNVWVICSCEFCLQSHINFEILNPENLITEKSNFWNFMNKC